MAKKKTLTERLRSMALELRANLLLADENLRGQALVAPTDRLYAGVRQDLERLVRDMEGLANRLEAGVLGGAVIPGTVKH
jgi:hypothetical protein